MSVLQKNGLGFLFIKSSFSKNPQKVLNDSDQHEGRSIAERIRISCEELGPTFVKLGQILSTRSDLVPDSIAKELAKLQDSVKPFSYEEARQLIESELEGKIEDIFGNFMPEPVASASVSQVYRAWLHSGLEVAVKVQRPHIQASVDMDLSVLEQLASFIDKRTKYGKIYEFSGMVAELRRVMEQEMNFITEGEHIDRFRENLKKHTTNIFAPRVKWVYTTSKVLTMEFIEGIKIDDVVSLDKIGADKKKLAFDFTSSLIDQMLIDGFFHADPHPGNVMVVDGKNIAFIDLGMAGTVSTRFQKQLTNMITGIATKNTRKIAQSIMDMDAAQASVNQRKFSRSLDILLDEYLYSPLGDVNIAQVFTSVFTLASSYHMKIPREFTLVAKALGTAQKIVETLDPKSNILELAEKIVRENFGGMDSVKELMEQARSTGLDILDLLKQFPSVLLNFLRKTEENDFALELKIKDLEKTQNSLERMLNRVSFSVVLLAVCIVMAGVIVATGFRSRGDDALYEFNVLALQAGLVVSIIIVVGLIISMIRSGRSK